MTFLHLCGIVLASKLTTKSNFEVKKMTAKIFFANIFMCAILALGFSGCEITDFPTSEVLFGFIVLVFIMFGFSFLRFYFGKEVTDARAKAQSVISRARQRGLHGCGAAVSPRAGRLYVLGLSGRRISER